jgi:hypothetical protein
MVLVPLSENPKGKKVIVVLSTFIFLDYVFVAIRFTARRIKRTPLELNDWAMLVSLVSMIFDSRCQAPNDSFATMLTCEHSC